MRHTQTHEISQVTQKLAIQLDSYFPQPQKMPIYLSLSFKKIKSEFQKIGNLNPRTSALLAPQRMPVAVLPVPRLAIVGQ